MNILDIEDGYAHIEFGEPEDKTLYGWLAHAEEILSQFHETDDHEVADFVMNTLIGRLAGDEPLSDDGRLVVAKLLVEVLEYKIKLRHKALYPFMPLVRGQ